MKTNRISSISEYKKAFIQIGKQLFKKYGFQYYNKCFYRKNIEVFQAFSLTRPGCIDIMIAPFWCDLRSFGIYGDMCLSSSICEGLFKPSSFMTDYYFFNCSFLSLEEFDNELKHFANTFLKELGRINDERSYIDYLIEKKRYFNCPEEVILFVSYKESKIEIALEWIKQLNCFLLNEYIWNLDQRIQETLCLENSEKRYIDYVFFEGYWRNVRCRYPKLYQYVAKKDIGIDIESFYEKESIKMREIYRYYFKLDF